MLKNILTIFLFIIISTFSSSAQEAVNYEDYHQQVIQVEELIVAQKYQAALNTYEQLFENYDFIFLRDYQVATQLALMQEEHPKALLYLQRGIQAGWPLKSIKNNDFIQEKLTATEWEKIKKEYPELRAQYEARLNQDLQKQVKKMFKRDQWKALKALFRFSSKAQDKYAERKFAPHSEQQIEQLQTILKEHGYPGEQLIGTGLWMSTILSHHNSISTAYNQKDPLYPQLKPQLQAALKKGQMAPIELATIDDWYRASKYNRTLPPYGILDPPSTDQLTVSNELRAGVFLRPIELRKALLEVQEQTGMILYLPVIW